MEPAKLLALLLLLLPSLVSAYRKRIVGGQECNEAEHPWLVLLYQSKKPFCSGILLDYNWVLTAAHCYVSGEIEIRLGLHNRNVPRGDEQMRVSAATLCYPDTASTTQNSCADFTADIMMIKLNSPVKYSKHIGPLLLPSGSVSVGTECRVMGWGTTTTSKVTLPIVPHCANINILENRVCAVAYPSWRMTNDMLCAGDQKGCKDSCQGDSGGPLICGGQLQGVVSMGISPGPGVYTNVNSYFNWILEFI
uniref:Kallikrein-Abr-2 n=1 Tax=Abronia graminea TaxID=278977 RepID=K4I265_ABRGR